MRPCAHCGVDMVGAHGGRKFCTRKCKDAAAYLRNMEQAKVTQAAYRAKTKAARAAYDRTRPSRAVEHRKRYAANPLPYQQHRDRRRAGSGGGDSIHYTTRDWRRLLARYRGCCAYCGSAADIEMEHVIPLARGGRDHIGNVVPACRPCNRSKHSKFLMEWKLLNLKIAALTAA